jgi:hypothetical protein
MIRALRGRIACVHMIKAALKVGRTLKEHLLHRYLICSALKGEEVLLNKVNVCCGELLKLSGIEGCEERAD